MLISGCEDVEVMTGVPENVKKFRITMVAKSADNPVFLSALSGAEAAATNLSDKYSKIDIEIDWRTPKEENASVQAERIVNAVNDGTDAIMVACSSESILTQAIDHAVDKGVPVMTFDSDAPKSKRFAFYGSDDQKIGETIMDELAKLIGNKGQIAILAGNKEAPNLKKRVVGVKKAASKYPDIDIIDVFYHIENASIAADLVLKVNREHPELDGWAMIGGWPLFGDGLMNGIDPNKIKIVAVDALPVQLPYVEKGIVPVLIAQPTFRWGKISVEKIIDKIYFNKDVPENIPMKLIRVSKDNFGGWSRQLRAWGYTGIPRHYLRM
jgi:ribose transport system substrate-binding protein